LRCNYPFVRKVLPRMLPRPIFMIHGERDSYIPDELARHLFALAPEPKSLWIVPGAKHNQGVIVAPDEYAEKTVGFFDHYLAGIIATTEKKTPKMARGA